MQRSIKLKRIYTLGQFQNLEVTDELTDIPEELANDERYVESMRYAMLMGLEVTINKYYMVRELIRELDPEQTVELLESEKAKQIAKSQANINLQKGA